VSYASREQWEAWSAHIDSASDAGDVQALLDRATADLDAWLCWPMPPDPDPLPTPLSDLPPVGPVVLAPVGRIDPASLTWWQRDCLAKACVLQALYRLEVDESSLIEGRPQVQSVGGLLTFDRAGPDPISPAAITALAGAGLLVHRTGCAPPDAGPRAA
jgi:hypothetical protein